VLRKTGVCCDSRPNIRCLGRESSNVRGCALKRQLLNEFKKFDLPNKFRSEKAPFAATNLAATLICDKMSADGVLGFGGGLGK
jgi:hypothetical protein